MPQDSTIKATNTTNQWLPSCPKDVPTHDSRTSDNKAKSSKATPVQTVEPCHRRLEGLLFTASTEQRETETGGVWGWEVGCR